MKLIPIEDHQHDHEKIKSKINKMLNNVTKGDNKNNTLKEIYANKTPYYCRFINNNRKYFANVLIKGVSLFDDKKL